MKRFVAGFLTCLLLYGGVQAAEQYTATKANFDIVVKGNVVKDWGDVPPVVVNGRTLLPLKAVGDTLGVNVEWDQANKQVIVGDQTPIQTVAPAPTPQKQEGTKVDNIVYKGSMDVDGVKIEISGKIDIGSSRRVHIFRFTNTTKTDQSYDAKLIQCNTGATYIYERSPIDGILPLTNGVLKPGESIERVIAFSNSDLATSSPLFVYKAPSNKLRIID